VRKIVKNLSTGEKMTQASDSATNKLLILSIGDLDDKSREMLKTYRVKVLTDDDTSQAIYDFPFFFRNYDVLIIDVKKYSLWLTQHWKGMAEGITSILKVSKYDEAKLKKLKETLGVDYVVKYLPAAARTLGELISMLADHVTTKDMSKCLGCLGI
jgi:hypothetical protein